MSFNLMSGLMTGANFGQGFVQGQDQQQDRQFRNQQMQQQGQAAAMAMLMNRMKLQQEQKNLGYDQDEGSYARQLATDPDTADLPMDQHMDLMAKNALSKGDLVRANEFATNATNFRNAQVMQDWKKQNIAKSVMESQQKLHQWMGNELATAADPATGGPEAFEQARQTALDAGHGTPEDLANLRNLQYPTDPVQQAKLAQALRLGSMNSRQAAKTLIEQQNTDLRRNNDASLDRNRSIRQNIQEQRIQMAKDAAAAKTKAGGGMKAPTQNELDQSVPYLKELKDQGLEPADLAQAQQDLVGQAKQLQKVNPNISFAQALQQAKTNLPKNIQTTTIPSKIPGMEGTTKVTYKMPGATPKDAIPYTGDQSSLIPGRYYQTQSHGIVQFTGTGFKPIE